MLSLLPEIGVGIELSRHLLRAAAARSFLGRVEIVDRLEIPELDQRSAAECRELYNAFLKRNGLESPWTVVALPRAMSLYRELKFPANVGPELQSIMAMQVDSLHAFGDEEIVWDFAVSGSSQEGHPTQPGPARGIQRMTAVAAVVARESAVESRAAWFEERGIPVSQFAASPLLLKSIMESGLNEQQSAGRAGIAYLRDTLWELLAVAPAGVPSARVLDLEPIPDEERPARLIDEIERLLATLRREDSAEPVMLIGSEAPLDRGLWEKIRSAIGTYAKLEELPAGALADAAARASVDKARSRFINLLPASRRRFVPSMSLAPTYGMTAIVILMCLALGVRGTIQDWLYSRRLNDEISGLRPRITEIEAVRGRQRDTFNQLLALTSVRNSARIPLEVLEDLTRSLPRDAWLQGLQMEGSTLTISGSAASASGVLQSISQARTLESPQFLSAISRSSNGEESFRIGARLRLGLR